MVLVLGFEFLVACLKDNASCGKAIEELVMSAGELLPLAFVGHKCTLYSQINYYVRVKKGLHMFSFQLQKKNIEYRKEISN